MGYLAFAIICVGMSSLAAWLVIEGHPWFAGAILLILCGVKLSDK